MGLGLGVDPGDLCQFVETRWLVSAFCAVQFVILLVFYFFNDRNKIFTGIVCCAACLAGQAVSREVVHRMFTDQELARKVFSWAWLACLATTWLPFGIAQRDVESPWRMYPQSDAPTVTMAAAAVLWCFYCFYQRHVAVELVPRFLSNILILTSYGCVWPPFCSELGQPTAHRGAAGARGAAHRRAGRLHGRRAPSALAADEREDDVPRD